MNHHYSVLALTLGLPLFACTAPEVPPDRNAVERGRAVAQQWCSDCHRISREQQTGVDNPSWASAPSFMAIAQNPNVDPDYLRDLASKFYCPKTVCRLRKDDQEDVVSYILSLRDQI
jgi:mono/diheme cytochrome c family protein